MVRESLGCPQNPSLRKMQQRPKAGSVAACPAWSPVATSPSASFLDVDSKHQKKVVSKKKSSTIKIDNPITPHIPHLMQPRPLTPILTLPQLGRPKIQPARLFQNLPNPASRSFYPTNTQLLKRWIAAHSKFNIFSCGAPDLQDQNFPEIPIEAHSHSRSLRPQNFAIHFHAYVPQEPITSTCPQPSGPEGELGGDLVHAQDVVGSSEVKSVLAVVD